MNNWIVIVNEKGAYKVRARSHEQAIRKALNKAFPKGDWDNESFLTMSSNKLDELIGSTDEYAIIGMTSMGIIDVP